MQTDSFKVLLKNGNAHLSNLYTNYLKNLDLKCQTDDS